MNIMFEDSITDEVRSRYTILALDKFYSSESDSVSTAYCLVENIPIPEMATLENYVDLHENMMSNFYKRNWSFCEQAIEHLTGRWNGEVDSFYDNILTRITTLKNTEDLDESWNGILIRN